MFIRLCSFNCNSVCRKVDVVRTLLNCCDILVLQELILLNEDVDFLDGIDQKFDCIMYAEQVSNEGRTAGDLAISTQHFLSRQINLRETQFESYFAGTSNTYVYAFPPFFQ